MLDAKENLLRAVKFENPEYVPHTFTLPLVAIAYYGANPEDIEPGTQPSRSGKRLVWRDIWGTGWEKVLEDIMPLYKKYPLTELEEWRDYEWMDPKSSIVTSGIREQAEKVDRARFLLSGSHRSTILERSWKLVGMAKMMRTIFTDPDRAMWLFTKLIDFALDIAEEYVRVGIGIAQLGDDHGHQKGLLLSPEIFRKFLKPQYKRLIDFYHGHGVLIDFHSCGRIQDLIDDFLDLRIDILNPVQDTANDQALIRKKTQGRMALQGGIPTSVVMHGTPADVTAVTKRKLFELGKYGGYVAGPDQSLPFPKSNVLSLIRTVDIYGRYPLSQ